MKKFIVQIVSFVMVVMLFFIAQFFLLRGILNSHVDYKLEHIQTLVLGNSQPQMALNDSILGNCKNIALGGDPLIFNYVKLKKVLKFNKQIKTVVLGGVEAIYDRGFFEIPRMTSKYKLYFYLMDWEEQLALMRYNPGAFIRGFCGISYKLGNPPKLFRTKKWHDLNIGGYVTSDRTWREKDLDNYRKDDYNHLQPVPIQEKYLQKIIALCEEQKVQLIILDIPVHPALTQLRGENYEKNYNKYLSTLDSNIIKAHYTTLKLEDNDFADCIHLNQTGAAKFSTLIKRSVSPFNK